MTTNIAVITLKANTVDRRSSLAGDALKIIYLLPKTIKQQIRLHTILHQAV